jgi:hypothetical protein
MLAIDSCLEIAPGFGGTVDTGGYIGATLPNRPENL